MAPNQIKEASVGNTDQLEYCQVLLRVPDQQRDGRYFQIYFIFYLDPSKIEENSKDTMNTMNTMVGARDTTNGLILNLFIFDPYLLLPPIC